MDRMAFNNGSTTEHFSSVQPEDNPPSAYNDNGHNLSQYPLPASEPFVANASPQPSINDYESVQRQLWLWANSSPYEFQQTSVQQAPFNQFPSHPRLNTRRFIDPKLMSSANTCMPSMQATPTHYAHPRSSHPTGAASTIPSQPYESPEWYERRIPADPGAQHNALDNTMHINTGGGAVSSFIPQYQLSGSSPFPNVQHQDVKFNQNNYPLYGFFPQQPGQSQDFRVQDSARPAHTSQRFRTHTTNRQKLERIPSEKCEEPGCSRGFRPKVPGARFCGRHQEKYERNHAGAPVFHVDRKINSFETAQQIVYPKIPPLQLEHDDVIFNSNEDEWIAKFIEAANKPYDGSSEYPEFHSRQQKVFNGKGFDNITVNVRLRFLYKAALTFHEGGAAVYPKGGDNDGYGSADKSLIFSDRMNAIVEILETDKRVCMDVIEGRGVLALVANPHKYEKRKTQNKDSNERKQKKQKLGDKIQEKMKAKGKAPEGSEIDGEDYSDEEDKVAEEEIQAAAVGHPKSASYGQSLDADATYGLGPATVQRSGGKRKRGNGDDQDQDLRSTRAQPNKGKRRRVDDDPDYGAVLETAQPAGSKRKRVTRSSSAGAKAAKRPRITTGSPFQEAADSFGNEDVQKVESTGVDDFDLTNIGLAGEGDLESFLRGPPV